MGGLLVLITLALFIGFCWLVSGWIVRDRSDSFYGVKRGALFLLPALMPFYIQLVEYILFQQACKEAVVYFPEDKPPVPDILITNDQTNKNQGRYYDGMFKYIVSPHYSNHRSVDLTKSKEQFYDYIVYPYKSEPIGGNEKIQVLDKIRYVLVHRPAVEWSNWYSYRSEIYIYDFIEEKKITQLIEVFPQSYQRSLLGFFHARFEGCPNKTDFDYGYNEIIKNTFIMEREK